MDNRKIKKYVELADKKKRAEANIDEIKQQMKVLEEYLLDNMMKAGQQSANLDGHTVYVHRQLWASAANGAEALHEALEQTGHGELVEPKVNSQRLSALVREFEQDEEGMPILPGALKEAVKVSEKYSVRVRKS